MSWQFLQDMHAQIQYHTLVPYGITTRVTKPKLKLPFLTITSRASNGFNCDQSGKRFMTLASQKPHFLQQTPTWSNLLGRFAAVITNSNWSVYSKLRKSLYMCWYNKKTIISTAKWAQTMSSQLWDYWLRYQRKEGGWRNIWWHHSCWKNRNVSLDAIRWRFQKLKQTVSRYRIFNICLPFG